MPALLKKSLVTLLTAALLLTLVAGGQWLLRHPMPAGGWSTIAMVAGLGAMVYGARHRR
ncbi:MAG: hypothetical protein IT479_01765 [Xanthomonadales bacterium]|nr:hypothetical protein [Xanthomonadales bacterium]MCC6591976.1 hypothetical protein [Xanthomonadales bacterium]